MAYGTLSGLIAYAAARGTVVANAPASEQALLRGIDHIRYTWVARFLPGYSADSDGVEEATYEAALLELATPFLFSGSFTPAQQKVLTGVGSLTWTVSGDTDSSDAWANATPTSLKVAAILSSYMPGKFQIGLKAIG